MSEQNLTIAVVGAGGKMGMRVSDNLQRSTHTVRYSENSPAWPSRPCRPRWCRSSGPAPSC
jgi:nucleoside-diphosphate-sugar epimerase